MSYTFVFISSFSFLIPLFFSSKISNFLQIFCFGFSIHFMFSMSSVFYFILFLSSVLVLDKTPCFCQLFEFPDHLIIIPCIQVNFSHWSIYLYYNAVLLSYLSLYKWDRSKFGYLDITCAIIPVHGFPVVLLYSIDTNLHISNIPISYLLWFVNSHYLYFYFLGYFILLASYMDPCFRQFFCVILYITNIFFLFHFPLLFSLFSPMLSNAGNFFVVEFFFIICLLYFPTAICWKILAKLTLCHLLIVQFIATNAWY